MDESLFVLDIGGEGRHAGAWNLNPRTHRTVGSQRGQPIPRLIRARSEAIPLAAQSVDVVIVERTPLWPATLAEILRVARPSATIVLRHARAHGHDPHRVALQHLRGAVEQRTAFIGRQDVQETVIRLSESAATMPLP
jgi:hypothetical protein